MLYKDNLVKTANQKGYTIVGLMLATQPEEILHQNIETAKNRLAEIGSKENVMQEIKENLQQRFKFNDELSTKFAEVITEVL